MVIGVADGRAIAYGIVGEVPGVTEWIGDVGQAIEGIVSKVSRLAVAVGAADTITYQVIGDGGCNP